ncbi:hypothetical protein GCM10018783_27250 [Streptomyces griseosporeus]|nr:hypothetical protein GCM10018783_27250 [Streptomyces griseosporeus]
MRTVPALASPLREEKDVGGPGPMHPDPVIRVTEARARRTYNEPGRLGAHTETAGEKRGRSGQRTSCTVRR